MMAYRDTFLKYAEFMKANKAFNRGMMKFFNVSIRESVEESPPIDNKSSDNSKNEFKPKTEGSDIFSVLGEIDGSNNENATEHINKEDAIDDDENNSGIFSVLEDINDFDEESDVKIGDESKKKMMTRQQWTR